MAAPSTTGGPTPERIFNLFSAYHGTEALKTGIELDVFTAIGQGANTPALLALKVNASERGLRILCDYLTLLGLLTKEQRRYALTQESAMFLDRRSRACLAPMAGFLGGEWHRKNFDLLTEAVRKGGTAGGNGDNTKPKDEVWVAFARSMAPLTARPAAFLAQLVGAPECRPCKVLDIAAGHGMYGIAIGVKNPNAQIVGVDWPAVLVVAKENARAAGISDRYTTREGSAFETDLGEGYDLALLTNIFHHFNPPTCEKLMRRIHAALKPGGRAATLEFIPNEDRVSPHTAAAFSLTMLAATDAGDAYTFSEYEKMFANSGFVNTTLHEIPQMPQRIVLSERPL